MSFSADVKDELSRLEGLERHCALAELSAIIRFGGRIRMEEQRVRSLDLHTENVAAARRFYILMKENFEVQPVVSASKHDYLKKNRFYTIRIENGTEATRILKAVRVMDDLGRIDETFGVRDNPLLQRSCCRRAYLRGAFLSSGSITDPEKNYHFEIVCTGRDESFQIRTLFDSFGLDARIVTRKRYQVVYLKEGSMISDALNIMGAHQSLMRFENIRILKDVRNSVNRRVNCEAANINKTVSAARRQIEDIEYIENTVGLDKLPDNLKAIAYARLEDPDASLKELGMLLDDPIGKSGVNHRLRKISGIAQDIRERGYL